MNKLPVGQTIRFAYDFTFGQIGTVIGLIWIPTVIYSVANFFVIRASYPALADALESGAVPAGPEAFLPLVPFFLALILFAMIGVAITGQALGLRKGPVFAHIAFGGAELRVLAGFVGLYLLLFLFVLGFTLVVTAVAATGLAAVKGSGGAAPIVGLALVAVFMAGFCGLAYVGVRLGFLLVPAILDGGEFGLSRSWTLTKGNFWRIVAIALATMMPVFIVLDIADSLILGPQNPDPGTIGDEAGMLRLIAEQLRATLPHMPLLLGVNFVISPVMYGLMFAPAAFAYRVLSGKGTVPPQAD